ncbi:MAG TPA: hypothetical protein VF994_15545 [Myxococcales bacterium]
MRANGIAILGAFALLTSCASSRPGRVHRFGACKPVVQGREILCDGSHMAAIECHGRAEGSCRALAIRYHDGNVAWLYQAPWFNPDRPESAFERESPYDWASAVEVTPDALYLWYRTDDEIGTRWIEYDVQAGMQRPVERFRIVELREIRYRGDVVQVPLFDPARDTPDRG